MKRVLLINCAVTTFNGVTSVISNYVEKTYCEFNYDLVLAGGYEEKFLEQWKCGINNIYKSPWSRTRKPIKYYFWLIYLMKRNIYDVVHIHCNSATAFIELHAAKTCGIPIRIIHSHTSKGKYPLVHKVLKTRLNREMTIGIACSKEAGDWMFLNNYLVLPNGINLDKYRYEINVRNEYRAFLGIEGKFVVGHVGYMDIEKNHKYLVSFFCEFNKLYPNSVLLLIGDGRLRTEIENMVEELGISHAVLFLGKRNDIEKIYQAMDVFVLPSLWEGLPVSLLEAQTAGLPCLVSSTVTRSVNVTKKLTFIDIDEVAKEIWCMKLCSIASTLNDRSSGYSQMKNSEFDIENSTNQLSKIYMESKRDGYN